MRASLCLVALAACGSHAASPTPVANRAPTDSPACPAAPSPFQPEPPTTPEDECVHGEPSPWFVGPGTPPACHVYTPTGPTSADEAITLADGRRIWLRQSGCSHALFELRAVPRAPFDRADRAAMIRAGAALLEDAAAVTPDVNLANDAAAVAAEAASAPTGPFPIGSGDNFASIDSVEGTEMISVAIDFPL